MGLILGVYNLQAMFDEKYYDNLPGGLFEAFGRGFGHKVKLFLYPAINVEDGSLYDIDTIRIPDNLRGLLKYMIDNDKIAPILEYDKNCLHIMSDDVLSKIKSGGTSWEEDVPYQVVKAIKFFELFGYENKVIGI